MRLENVASGHRLPQKLLLLALRTVLRADPPDVLKLSLYRPEFFGTPYTDLLDAIMRGPSAWSVGERELFAAFVSKQNQCAF